MNCKQAQALLPQMAGGELAIGRVGEARAHAAACSACTAYMAELGATVSLCQRAGEEALPVAFALELHRRIAEAGPLPAAATASLAERLRTIFGARPLASLAAAGVLGALLALGGAYGVTHFRGRVAGFGSGSVAQGTPTYKVPASKIALVRVDFVAAAAVDDVHFEVLLPDGLRFLAEGQELAERSFQWTGKLVAGANPIPIVVKGKRPGRYRVIAHATGPGVDVTQEVVLEVVS